MTYLYFSDKEKEKIKLEEDEAAAASTMAVSASLMPPIWDKTIPYDGESFHLEYMDLDEFLLENGIPSSPTHLDLNQNPLLPVAELEGKESAGASTGSPASSSSAAVYQQSEAASSTGTWNNMGLWGTSVVLILKGVSVDQRGDMLTCQCLLWQVKQLNMLDVEP